MARPTTLGGGLLLVAGGFVGRETLSWAWQRLLDLFTAGAGDAVTWQTFTWANAIGVALMIAGVAVLGWPAIQNLRRRTTVAFDGSDVRQIASDVTAARIREERTSLLDQIDGIVSRKAAVVARDVQAELDERFDAQLKQIAILAGEQAGLKAEIEKRLTSLDYAIGAIGHREHILRWSGEIERLGEELSLTPEDDVSDTVSWEEWLRKFMQWESKLEDWLLFSSPYRVGLRDEVKHNPEEKYDPALWNNSDQQFPHSAAVQKYKTFRIWYTNWLSLRKHAHQAVREVAFDGKIPISVQLGK